MDQGLHNRGSASRGVTWLTAASLAHAALWFLLLGAALGAAFDLAAAASEIQAHRYVPLGFQRTIHLLLEDAADQGALDGARTAGAWILGALFLLCFPAVRALANPREFTLFLRTPSRVARAQVAILIAFGATGLALSFTEALQGRIHVVLLCIIALVGVALLALLSRGAARSEQPLDAARVANTFGAGAAALIAVAFAFPVIGPRLWRATAPESLVVFALYACACVGAFVLARRAALFSEVGGRGPLGGWRTRTVLGLLLLPALAPLCVRAFASLYGHSGVDARTNLNVVLIGIDTLRADAVDLEVPAEGARDRTPHLRALASRGMRFTHAVSQSPWTMPAFASILTGKYPLEHGAVSLTGRLRRREVLLQEILREAGYRTGSFVANTYTDSKHGFSQGSDVFGQEFILEPHEVSSSGISDQAIEFVQADDARPFFLFAHYMDPHYKYVDQPDWQWADAYTGWWKDQNDIDNLVRNRNLLKPEDVAWLRNIYDEEIAFTDRQIGRLLAALEARGVLDRTLIIVVADHGEEFLDHGNLSHTTTLYNEVVRVPLIVVPPARPGGLAGVGDGTSKRTDVVETRSVFTTVLESLGVEFAFRSRPRSLLSPPEAAPAQPEQAGGAHGDATGYAFSIVWLPDALPKWGKKVQVAALSAGRWKLIHHVTRGVYELYDLDADPRESTNLATKDAATFDSLRGVLDDWLEGQKQHAVSSPNSPLDPKLSERLRSLGYM